MAGLFDQTVLDEILVRTDIVELIGSYIPLKRAGRNFKASCPFHHEKTASFMVSPDKQIYHCFGCGAGGNAFNFLVQYERMDFREAVEFLARKSAVVLPQSPKLHHQNAGIVTDLYKVNSLASAFYHAQLKKQPSSSIASSYTAKRTLTPATIDIFKIGFAPDSWDGLLSYLRQNNADLKIVEKAGLVLRRLSGEGYYDRFRNRLIFPISDIKSNVIGFGARYLPAAGSSGDSQPKYVNSPETPIYVKGRHLYGLDIAKDAIRQADQAVIVEGYLDCIVPYQHGLHNIVASLGTALTQEQVRLLKRYTHNICLVYDGDAAGQMASLRSLDIFIEEGVHLHVVSLPQGYDPDSYVRSQGIEKLKSLIAQADDFFDYQLKLLSHKYSIKDAHSKSKIASEILPTIKKVKDSILTGEYIKKLAEALDVAEQSVWDSYHKIKHERVVDSSAPVSFASLGKIPPTEQLLIKLMLENNDDIINRIKDQLQADDFQDVRTNRIARVLFDTLDKGTKLHAQCLLNCFPQEDIAQLVCETSFSLDIPQEQQEQVVSDCILRIKQARMRKMRHDLQQQIKKAQDSGDNSRVTQLMEEFHILINKKG